MEKIVSIHQPNYIPWSGYFYKISKSDTFIFLDNVAISKQSYFNRVKINDNNSTCWLTIPLKLKLGMKINQAFSAQIDWKKRHFSKIYNTYKGTKYFREVWRKIEEIYDFKSNICVSEANKFMIVKISKILEYEINFLDSKNIKIKKDSVADDRLIDLIIAVNGSKYLSGSGGSKYQNESKFKVNNIDLVYAKNLGKAYIQNAEEFHQGLSIIDIFFRIGFLNTKKYIESNFILP
tara:strand:- start:1513 stop:2217 length:705 start_codon:yes stop_codon:yes gene_type:complete